MLRNSYGRKLKCLSATFAALVLSQSIALASGGISISYDIDKNTAKITGNAEVGVKYAALEILKKDKTEDDVLYSDVSELGTVILHADQVEIKDGNFEFLFTLPSESETYNYVARVSFGSVENGILAYVSYSDFTKALEYINSGEVNNKNLMYEAIENAKEYFGINVKDFDLLKKAEKQRIAEKVLADRDALTDKRFSDSESFLESFNPVFLIEMINHCSDENSDFDAEKLIWNNQNTLKFSETLAYETFEALGEDVKTEIVNSVCEKNDYESIVDIQDEFSFQTVNYALYKAKGYDVVSDILKNNKEFLGISFSDYNNLSSKSSVDKNMIGEKFSSKEEIKEKFDSLVDKASDKQSSGDSGSSGGSGGGGSKKNTNTLNPALGNSTVTEQKEVFLDLKNTEWAKESILSLHKRGIINGKQEGIFAPNDLVTREEFVKMLIIMLDCVNSEADCEFSDVLPGTWYYLYVASGVECGLIKGISPENFGTGQNISRQDIAVLTSRAADFLGIMLTNTKQTVFNDFDGISEYAKESVLAISGAGIVNGTGSGNFEPKRGTTRAEAAKILYEFSKLMQKGE